jgi:hypothetical protein
LEGAASKGAFVMGLCRGMGSNLDIETRKELYEAIFEWSGHLYMLLLSLVTDHHLH